MLSRVGLIVALCVAVSDGQTTSRPSLRERAAAGDPEAQFNLAKNLETGRGGNKKDFIEAEHWYRRAAEQGDPFAQASLAILYRFGKGGIRQDLVEAYKWFHLAASRTSGSDRESIAEMLGWTAERMTAKQIVHATELARAWKAKGEAP